jgi:hypothetical protein
MTSIHQEALPIDAAELPDAGGPWAEVRDALVAIAVAVAGVASAVAIVIIPQLFPSPAPAPVVCRATQAEQTAGL